MQTYPPSQLYRCNVWAILLDKCYVQFPTSYSQWNQLDNWKKILAEDIRRNNVTSIRRCHDVETFSHTSGKGREMLRPTWPTHDFPETSPRRYVTWYTIYNLLRSSKCLLTLLSLFILKINTYMAWDCRLSPTTLHCRPSTSDPRPRLYTLASRLRTLDSQPKSKLQPP